MPLDFTTNSSPNLTSTTQQVDPFGNLMSLFGGAGSVYNQQQNYNVLQNALGQIGPTQLSSNQLSGPGGMSTGYNPLSGQGSIDLGSLNPAFGGFAGAAGGGANSYNSGLPSFLSGNAMGQLGNAGQALSGAYGNYGQGMSAANQQLGQLGNFNNNYNNLLSQYQNQLAPGIQQQAYGLQNTLFGNGVSDSTGAASGSLASANFGRGVAQATSGAQLNAYQGALQGLQTGVGAYGSLSSSAGNILGNAFNNFGNTNQLISGLNTAGLNNAATAAQGAGALNTMGLNNYNSGLQSALANSTARNQSLFPYAGVATALSGTQNGLGLGANMLSQAGANGGGLGGLLNTGRQIYNGYNQLSNWLGGSPGVSAGDWASAYQGLDSSTAAQLGNDFSSSVGSDLSSYFGGFNAAGGEAAGAAGSTLGGALDTGYLGSLGTAADTTGMGAIDATTMSGAGVDAGAGAAGVSAGVAALPLAALLGVAAHQNPTAFNQNYWNGLNQTLAGGPGSGVANYGANNALAPIAQRTQYEGALADLAHDYSGQGQGNSTIPNSEWVQLAQYGITPQSVAGYNNSWAAAAANMPSLMAYNDAIGIPNYSKPSSQGK